MEASTALNQAAGRSTDGPAVNDVVGGVLRASVVPDDFDSTALSSLSCLCRDSAYSTLCTPVFLDLYYKSVYRYASCACSCERFSVPGIIQSSPSG